jgi:polysaccharide export outer membrane protein
MRKLKAIPVISLLLVLNSCGSVTHQQLMMFDKIQNETSSVGKIPALKIRPDDILNIQVASRNPERVSAFRNSPESIGSAGQQALGTQEGYRVDEEGNIYLPFLGKVEAAGKTTAELRHKITEGLAVFLPDVSVQVRFVNFRVTLLGEVNKPNTYSIPNERLTILEAIGMAGDFTSYARRNAILVIRERNDKREFARIDIQDKNLFMSPFFYLSPNDIVYIEPLKAKQYATQGDFFQRYSTLFIPLASLTTFFLGVVFF